MVLERHNPDVTALDKIFMAMGSPITNNFISFKEAKNHVENKIAKLLLSKPKKTPQKLYKTILDDNSICNNVLEKLAFYLLMRNIFEEKLSIWNKIPRGYEQGTIAILNPQMPEHESNYFSFIKDKKNLYALKFNQLAGSVNLYNSTFETNITDTDIYKHGKLSHQTTQNFWIFKLHEDRYPFLLNPSVPVNTGDQTIERIREYVKRVNKENKTIKESLLSFTFKMIANQCIPYAEYHEFGNISLPFDSDFRQFAGKFCPNGLKLELPVYAERLFCVFLACHGFNVSNDFFINYNTSTPIYPYAEYQHIVNANILDIYNTFKKYVYLKKEELIAITDTIDERYIIQLITPLPKPSTKPSDALVDILASWENARDILNSIEKFNDFYQIVAVICKSNHALSADDLVKASDKTMHLIKQYSNESSRNQGKDTSRKMWDSCRKKINNFANSNGLLHIRLPDKTDFP